MIPRWEIHRGAHTERSPHLGCELRSLVRHNILRRSVETENMWDQTIPSLQCCGGGVLERNAVDDLGESINHGDIGGILIWSPVTKSTAIFDQRRLSAKWIVKARPSPGTYRKGQAKSGLSGPPAGSGVDHCASMTLFSTWQKVDTSLPLWDNSWPGWQQYRQTLVVSLHCLSDWESLVGLRCNSSAVATDRGATGLRSVGHPQDHWRWLDWLENQRDLTWPSSSVPETVLNMHLQMWHLMSAFYCTLQFLCINRFYTHCWTWLDSIK